MTIAIHHGPPGSYKSAGVVQRYAIPALLGNDPNYPNGRTVVTNIRGFDSIEKLENAYGVKCPPDSVILNLPTETREALEHAARWFHWAPIGAMIILDEAQAVYPSRRRDFKIENLDYPGGRDQADIDQRPPDVLMAFDMHRHYNWDVFLCTPNIGKVHTEIRQSAQAAFRHWDMSGLLPWKKGRWKELEHDPENNGKAASHGFGVPQEHKIDKRVFEVYQSTKTGKAQGPAARQSIFKDTKLRLVFIVIVCSMGWLAYSAQKIIERETENRAASEVVSEETVTAVPSVRDDTVNVYDGPGLRASQRVDGVDHPLAGFEFYIVGDFSRRHIFEGHFDDQEFSFTVRELSDYGYRVAGLSSCQAVIYYDGQEIDRVFCKPRVIREPDQRVASFTVDSIKPVAGGSR